MTQIARQGDWCGHCARRCSSAGQARIDIPALRSAPNQIKAAGAHAQPQARVTCLARDDALDAVVLVDDGQVPRAERAEQGVRALQRERLGHRGRAGVDVGRQVQLALNLTARAVARAAARAAAPALPGGALTSPNVSNMSQLCFVQYGCRDTCCKSLTAVPTSKSLTAASMSDLHVKSRIPAGSSPCRSRLSRERPARLQHRQLLLQDERARGRADKVAAEVLE